jgi:hypothetical protein
MIPSLQFTNDKPNPQVIVAATMPLAVGGQLYRIMGTENSGGNSFTYLCSPLNVERPYRGSPLEEIYISSSALHSLVRLDGFNSLPQDWGDGELERPSPTSIKICKEIVRQLDFHGLSPSRISASAEGGVALGFYRNRRYAGIEVLNDESVTALTSDFSGKIEAWDVDLKNLRGTADRIREHLEA